MRRVYKICACLLIFAVPCTLCISVGAHPGRTDSNGGHTNHSTGEYHYHHGYSAHDHYDMDGDGDIDCPYNFVDKTGQSNSNNSSTNIISQAPTVVTTTKTEIHEITRIPPWIYWVIAILLVVVLHLLLTINDRNKAEKRRQLSEAEQKAQLAKDLSAFHKLMAEQYGPDYLYTAINAPPGDYLNAKKLPCSSDSKDLPWGEKYTFYCGNPYAQPKTKFHSSRCRFSKSCSPINAYTLSKSKRYTPCLMCKPHLPDTIWVDKCRYYISILEKNGVEHPQQRSLESKHLR